MREEIKEKVNILLEAVEAERLSEEEYFKSLLQHQSIYKRVELGVAWYPASIEDSRYMVGEYLEVVVKRTNPTIKNHRLKEGVGVNFFNTQNNETNSWSGTISYIKGDLCRIILRSTDVDRSDIPDRGNFGVELVYDERPFLVMKQALQLMLVTKADYQINLINAILLGKSDGHNASISDLPLLPNFLNESQQATITGVLASPDVAVIHGPPGTGKTTTIVELVRILSKNVKKILVCAPSNNAVDLLAHRLSEKYINVIRLGNVSRIGDEIAHLTLDEITKNHQDWDHIKKVKIEAEESERMASKFKRNFGREEREQRISYQKTARELRKWARELEYRLVDDIIDQSKVITTTLIGSASKELEGIIFDYVIIDEASQTMSPECWQAILKGRKVVFVGDHKQLPPTIKSVKAKQLGLETTLLDTLTGQVLHSYMLRIQYRMNEKIIEWPNKNFYNGLLKSSDKVSKRTVGHLPPIRFIDTAGAGFEEKIHQENMSYFNEGEFFIIREHLLSHKEILVGQEIGIISPYAEQVRYIDQQIHEDKELIGLDITVNTIDGYQGQEKDVIYISLVRSNEKGTIGFLADERRINVAITRARKCLLIIGDSATLSNHSLFVNLLSFLEDNGAYGSAWEYMMSS